MNPSSTPETPRPPREHFQHCPRCGAALPPGERPNPLACPGCGFSFYFNTTVAVAAFVSRFDGRVLFIRRGREPAKGRLAPPGGFIDIGETAEAAVLREIQEEVGLRLSDLTFLCSQVNQYDYRGVRYPVLDLFFLAQAETMELTLADGEVTSYEWLDPVGVRPEDMAFPSMQAALRLLQSQTDR
jgi:NAD+ diphosphatase